MDDDPYERLAAALDRLPNAFPRTPSGVEIRILEKLCSPRQAALAAALTGTPEPVGSIARRVGRPVPEVRRALFDLVRLGFAWIERDDDGLRFRLAPFIVGIYEAQVDRMDLELARLVEEYLDGGGAAGIMAPQPALHRVVPSHDAVKTEWVLPYDDVRAFLVGQQTFQVEDCICRLQQAELGAGCAYPTGVCLRFSVQARDPRPGDITRDEAIALLDMTERVGLVHTVSNAAEGVGYVCNCCGCCCGLLRGITEWGIADSVAAASYVAVIDPDLCADCGTCVDRCQVHAIARGLGASVVDRSRCIGCGLCVSGCPSDVARLEPRPEAEVVPPPATRAEWERMRLGAREASIAVES